MKYLVTLGIIAILSGCAGMAGIPPVTSIDRVFEIKGSSKDTIYESTKMWIAENFKSAKAVIEYEDKKGGTIIGNGSIKYPCSDMLDCTVKDDWRVLFTMRVDVKDTKIRLTFTNILLTWPPSNSSLSGHKGPIATQGVLDDVKPALLKIGDEIVAFIGNPKNSSDW